jgi:hypothetical protein
MRLSLLLFATLTIWLTSCKKETFTHESPEIIYPCTCCELADTITGVYTGNLIRYDLSNWTINNPVATVLSDTVITIEITRNLSSSDFISDSLVCWFDIPQFFSQSVTLDNSLRIEQKGFDRSYFSHFSSNNEQLLTIENGKYLPTPPPPLYPFPTYTFAPSMSFNGVKQ